MTDAPLLRLARAEDAAPLAALARQTFIHTFVEEFAIPYPPDDLAAYLRSSFDAAELAPRLVDPGEAWWVMEEGGALVGFATAGRCGLPHPDVRPGHTELRRLYLAREAQGRGLGRRLLEEALAWMEPRTDGAMWIGVWSGNHRAQRLYAGYGFTKVGEYDYPVGAWLDREHILRRR